MGPRYILKVLPVSLVCTLAVRLAKDDEANGVSAGKRRLTTKRPAAATLPKRRRGRVALSKAILVVSATRVVLVTRLSSAATGAHTFHPAESFLRHPRGHLLPPPVGAYPFITPLAPLSSSISLYPFPALFPSSPVFRDANVPPPPAHSPQCDGGIDLKVHSCFHNAVSVPTLKRTPLCVPPPPFLLSLSFIPSSSVHIRVSAPFHPPHLALSILLTLNLLFSLSPLSPTRRYRATALYHLFSLPFLSLIFFLSPSHPTGNVLYLPLVGRERTTREWRD